MCSSASIRMQVMVFSWFKLGCALYIFLTGIYFSSSGDLLRAFGLEFVSYGLSLIFLGLLSAGVIIPHKYAINRHNRFLLAFIFVMDTIVFAELINYGVIVGTYLDPLFPKELQTDCLLNSPEIYTVDECTPFYNADRTAGMRLLWESYFSDKENKVSFQVLTTIEADSCCGFFQPYRCIENTDSFPTTRLTDDIDSALLAQRVTCGAYDDYYPAQSNCIDYEDFNADPPIVGGCYYDLGVGFCLDVPIRTGSLGCASAVEDYAVALISIHSTMLIVASIFSLLFMLYSCCMWWKRKDDDVFPEFTTDVQVKYQYKHVKDQFQVQPKKNLLVKEGDEEKLDEDEEAGMELRQKVKADD
ncbi:hypothetical protein B484DRAFT_90295 [Ochromonadaceae sp. CCMP2298]|nr:hypothetical protein B484DRAFT_90295 [Ochromonadaceae sp. CCMP2298]